MRALLFVTLLLAGPLCAQENCDVFNLQGLVANNAAQQAEIDALSCQAGVEMDGYRYYGVVLGDQCWFAENLRTTVYADGTAIPLVVDNAAWPDLSMGVWCLYDNDPAQPHGYGKLYNGYAATDPAGLCPTGWHVPTDGDWTALETHLANAGYGGAEGTALKSSTGWIDGGSGSDAVGFSALPGGNRNIYTGNFFAAGRLGYWWSSTVSGNSAFYRGLDSDSPTISSGTYGLRRGFSVRCLRDAE